MTFNNVQNQRQKIGPDKNAQRERRERMVGGWKGRKGRKEGRKGRGRLMGRQLELERKKGS